jgi:hypothetical protein
MPPKTAYRKKRGYKKRKRTAVKSVAQVKKIAKSVIYKEAESKYMNTSDHNERQVFPIQTAGNMTCLGFTTGDELDAVAGSNYQYGTGSMRPLNVHRVFDRGGSDPTSYQSLEGFYATPTFCQSRFTIERTITNTGNQNTPAQVLPYYCRVLRLVPRPRKSSNQSVQPNLDAFLDEQGLPTGVFVAGFDKLKLMTYKVNTRKYSVKLDTKFLMNTPCNFNTLDIAAGTTNASVNGGSLRTMNFVHDIGKKLFYKSPDASPNPNYPSSGFKNEFILFHFQTLGDNAGIRNVSNNIRISANAVSAFKDI